jgi:hypothetical protein
LFENLEGVFGGGIAQDNGAGFQKGGATVEPNQVRPRLKVERDGIAHHGEVLVVDG